MKHSVFFLVTIFFLCSLSNVVIGSDKNNYFKFIGKDSNTALIDAAKKGDIETVEWLLANGANINIFDEKGYTPLMWATYKYYFLIWELYGNIIKLLLKHDADVNVIGKDGKTALIIAALGGYTDILKLLLVNGADVNAVGEYGYPALIIAVKNGHTDIVERLLAHGAEVNAVGEYGDSALIIAASNGHTDIVERLLAYGAEVNAVGEYGDSALIIAASNGHTEIVKLLINNGANVNQVGEYGYTALIRASWKDYTEIVKLLLAHGADVNAVSNKYRSPVLTLAILNNNIEIAELLIEHGADVDAVNKDGKTALDLIREEDNFNFVKEKDKIEVIALLEDKIYSIKITVTDIVSNNIGYKDCKNKTVGYLLMLEKKAKKRYPNKLNTIDTFFKKIFKDKQGGIVQGIITNRMSLSNIEVLLREGYLDPNTRIIDEYHSRCLPSLLDYSFVNKKESLQELLWENGGLFSFDNDDDDDILHSWEIKEESIDEKRLRLKYLKYMNNNDKKYIT